MHLSSSIILPRTFKSKTPLVIISSKASFLYTPIKNNDSLGTNEVHDLIENKFGVDYIPKQTRIIINKLKYSWIKRYPIYSKSPDNAKEILKESTKEIDLDEDIYGFFDENAFQNHPNISKILKKREN